MKSLRFKFLILVALLIGVVQLFSLSTVFVYASSNEETILLAESTLTDNISSVENVILATERELISRISANKIPSYEKIQLEFDKTNVVDYYYVADGVSVTEGVNNSMEFEFVAIDEFGSLDIYADYGNGELAKDSIYTYMENDLVYISNVSKDQAWYDCKKEQYDAGLITMEEFEEAYSILSRTFVKKMETKASGVTAETLAEASNVSRMSEEYKSVVLQCKFFWETENGTKLPLRMTKIELRNKKLIGSEVVASIFTDKYGEFAYVFQMEQWDKFADDGFIRIYLESETFKVGREWLIDTYYIDADVDEKLIKEASDGYVFESECCIRYDESINVNKATYVQQGMVVGQRFAKAMGMKTNNFIRVIYPSGDGSIFPSDSAFCWGEINDNCYSIIGTNNFDNFDTLIHEYGHFVEVGMGNYGASLWEIIINNPNHYGDDDNFSEKPQKEYAMELTWSEAWATAFAQIAQKCYLTEYNGVPGFADIIDGKNYETFSFNSNSGEAQEDAVISFLWDLYDGETNPNAEIEDFDKISWGYQKWWNETTVAGTTTLMDFCNRMEDEDPSLRNDFGELLGAHQIAPSNLVITNESSIILQEAPSLSWNTGGSTYNPNDCFDICFYDGNDVCIYVISGIFENQYDVPPHLWEDVIATVDTKISIAIKGYHTAKSPQSGPYISKSVAIDENTIHAVKNLQFTLINNGQFYSVASKSDEIADRIYIPAMCNGKIVSEIADYAFENCVNLTYVSMPATLIRIGNYAFSNTGLTSVIIPACTEEIGESAFSDCYDLKKVSYGINCQLKTIKSSAFQSCPIESIEIPASVEEIEDEAFLDCGELRTVYLMRADIPMMQNATIISDNVFSFCFNLSAIIVPVNSRINAYRNQLNFLEDKVKVITTGLVYTLLSDGTYSVAKGQNFAASELVIPEKYNNKKVTVIADSAFNGCESLTKVTMLGNIEAIGSSAFNGCSGLNTITLPSSVTTIGNFAFAGCSALETIQIPNTVTYIGVGAFFGCVALESIQIPSGVTKIESSTFEGCSSLSAIQISSSVREICESALAGCSALESIQIPNSVREIGSYAFEGCSSLSAIQIPSSVREIGSRAFEDCISLLSIQIPSSINIIMAETFSGCSALNTIQIPSSVREIGNRAFEYCSALETVRIPSSVTKIGTEAFAYCTSLTSFYLPERIVTLDQSVFLGCQNLHRITIPNVYDVYYGYVQQFEMQYYKNMIQCETNGLTFTLRPNETYEVSCGDEELIGEVFIPLTYNGKLVMKISNNGFEGCTNITYVSLPNLITMIGDYAFAGCTSLGVFDVPSRVTSIGDYAFDGCTLLSSVFLPQNVVTIGASAFANCLSLSKIVVPDNTATYNGYVTQLAPQGLDDKLYRDVDGFIFTLLADGTYEVSRGATPLDGEIIIPDTYNGIAVTKIADYGFVNYFEGDIIIPSSIVWVGNYAFANCENLGMVVLLRTAADGITDISATAFNGSDNVCLIVFDEESYYAYYNDLVAKGVEELAEYIQFIMYI